MVIVAGIAVVVTESICYRILVKIQHATATLKKVDYKET